MGRWQRGILVPGGSRGPFEGIYRSRFGHPSTYVDSDGWATASALDAVSKSAKQSVDVYWNGGDWYFAGANVRDRGDESEFQNTAVYCTISDCWVLCIKRSV